MELAARLVLHGAPGGDPSAVEWASPAPVTGRAPLHQLRFELRAAEQASGDDGGSVAVRSCLFPCFTE